MRCVKISLSSLAVATICMAYLMRPTPMGLAAIGYEKKYFGVLSFVP